MKKLYYFHKRIVQIGGAELLLVHEANAWRNLGYDVVILCYFISPVIKKMLAPSVDIIEFVPGRPRNLLSNLIGLAKLLLHGPKLRDYIVICASGYIDLFLISSVFKFKYILEDHHPISMLPSNSVRNVKWIKNLIKKFHPLSIEFNVDNEKAQNRFNRLLRFFESLIYRKLFLNAFRVLVLSQYAVEEKLQIFGVESVCVPAGVNIGDLNTGVREIYQADTRTIISVSRLHPNKNIDILIKAFDLSEAAKNGAKLDIYGVGPDAVRLNRIRLDAAHACQIFFKGHLEPEKFAYVMRSCNLFVNLQFADYNLSNIEALSLSLPILIADCNEVPVEWLRLGLVHKTNLKNVQIVSRSIDYALTTITEKSMHEVPDMNQFSWESRVKKLEPLLFRNV